MGQHTLSGTQQPTRGHRAIAARIPSHLAIPKPFSIPPNETAIKEKEFGSNLQRIWVEKILKNPIFFSFWFLPTCGSRSLLLLRVMMSY